MFTIRDDELQHQVIFSTNRGKLQVSCNCRKTVGRHEKAGKIFNSPMGVVRNLEESRELYNNPENHWAEFTEEYKAKW